MHQPLLFHEQEIDIRKIQKRRRLFKKTILKKIKTISLFEWKEVQSCKPKKHDTEDWGNIKALWVGVLINAINDARIGRNQKHLSSVRRDAINFLDINNQNFLNICYYAEISPNVVLQCYEYAMQNNLKINITSGLCVYKMPRSFSNKSHLQNRNK